MIAAFVILAGLVLGLAALTHRAVNSRFSIEDIVRGLDKQRDR